LAAVNFRTMIETIKHNVWVFFARIRTKKEIKKLKQHLGDLSWHIGVEKMEEPELVKQYKETEVAIFMNETMLKGLQYL
jgi:hypothetical protein